MHTSARNHGSPFDRWMEITYPQQPLPVSPIYTGIARPGTTLALAIYDASGNTVGSQTIMADTGGNWLASFPSVPDSFDAAT